MKRFMLLYNHRRGENKRKERKGKNNDEGLHGNGWS